MKDFHVVDKKRPEMVIKRPYVIMFCFETVYIKNLEEKDGQRQLLYYVNLIRACKKVLYQLVYIGKKFVFLKKNLGI